jgi:hypothetical protein
MIVRKYSKSIGLWEKKLYSSLCPTPEITWHEITWSGGSQLYHAFRSTPERYYYGILELVNCNAVERRLASRWFQCCRIMGCSLIQVKQLHVTFRGMTLQLQYHQKKSKDPRYRHSKCLPKQLDRGHLIPHVWIHVDWSRYNKPCYAY